MCRSYGAVEPQDRFAPSVLSRPCHVICPGSCQLTEWSTWSGCHGDCGDGTMVAGRKTRSRTSYMVGDVSRYVFAFAIITLLVSPAASLLYKKLQKKELPHYSLY